MRGPRRKQPASTTRIRLAHNKADPAPTPDQEARTAGGRGWAGGGRRARRVGWELRCTHGDSNEVGILLPVVRQDRQAGGGGVGDCLLPVDPKEDVLAAARTATAQARPLPPRSQELSVALRVVQL